MLKKSVLALALLSVTATGTLAQFDAGGASRPAWEQFNLPKKTIKLEFRNASIDMILALYTKASGITIVKDPNLRDAITLTTAKAVSLADAFEILNAALSVRNYEMAKQGKILVIRQKQQRNQGFTMTPEMMQGMQGGSTGNIDLQVYKIKYANASQVAKVVNDVFQQSAGGGFPQMMFGGMGGRGGRGGGFSFGGGQTQPNVRASSDDYSNTVIVNAPRTLQGQIGDLITEIDKETDEPQTSRVFRLQYAESSTIQPVLQQVLQSNVPRGRGGSTGTQQGGGGGGFGFFPFGGFGRQNQNTAAGSVVADSRTNSVVVTSTQQNLTTMETLIKELDMPVEVQTTTFVLPLQNARADDVATLFRQAFGQRQGVSGAGGTSGRTNTNRNTTNTNTNRNTNNGNAGGGLGTGRAAGEIDVPLEDPNADAGPLETVVSIDGGVVAQNFQRQTGGGGSTTTGAGTAGRGADGRVVQVQDLTNQITVIPDQNTNSIIVVGNPEDAQIVRQILAQLDKIPEQVLIETLIVEASLDSSTKLGVEWAYTQNNAFGKKGSTGQSNQDFGLSADGSPQGFRYTLSGGNWSAFLNALQTDTRFNVLSTPRIFTSNNVQAEINISQRVPFVVSQRTDANGNITYNYDFEDVGIVLTVTPRITAGGYVTMDVSQTANDLQGFTDFNAPIVNQRQAQTTVAVKDGETVILGGIIRNSVSSTVKKIPILGDLPILGNLFRSTTKENQKTELLVFLTPKVVRNPDEASKLTDEEKLRMSKQTQDAVNKTTKKGDPSKSKEKSESNGGTSK
ncbi:MAG: hypothetical protein JST40_11585 [Armatimonadetes bacterium]|nr:hypothetical protein [Armatimonadota bacterium]